MIKALVSDVDGTLVATGEGHRQAFNAAFAEAGLEWVWDVRPLPRPASRHWRQGEDAALRRPAGAHPRPNSPTLTSRVSISARTRPTPSLSGRTIVRSAPASSG